MKRGVREMDKIIGYATNKEGEGYSQKIGEWESIEDVKIRIGMFTKDVVISFEWKCDDSADNQK